MYNYKKCFAVIEWSLNAWGNDVSRVVWVFSNKKSAESFVEERRNWLEENKNDPSYYGTSYSIQETGYRET